jgi:hypothetical protein
MKFCYLDESGTGSEPYAVMVGIIADAYRMYITKKDWVDLLEVLSKIAGKPIPEFHSRDFYSGKGPWYGLDGDIRSHITDGIFNWLKERNHKIVYSAVDKTKFRSDFNNEPFAKEIGSLWRFMALHICLAIQKYFQAEKYMKGNTILIFDNEERESNNFINIIITPPRWTETYYKRDRKQGQFDQIIDVPYFVDSRHVGLIQIADLLSYFMRKHIELRMGAIQPSYPDEDKLIEGWVNIALELSIPTSAIYPKTGRCQCADLFYRYAPACLL